MATQTADFWIQHLQLSQHIEGGWYTEVYRSSLVLDKGNLPAGFKGERNACTHIYFLLEKKGFSAFHRIMSDELWHFYAGDPLVIYEINGKGELKEHLLGNDIQKGQSLFCTINAGSWFASRVADGSDYGLAGCTVSPGFDFAEFELADRVQLSGEYPQYAGLINSLTY
ncbi:MAG: cupin domain-containing protein [Chitinophagaceae bacterium]|nr:cupin domain-containing protein [Chitinophagaceae bacterium]